MCVCVCVCVCACACVCVYPLRTITENINTLRADSSSVVSSVHGHSKGSDRDICWTVGLGLRGGETLNEWLPWEGVRL